MEIFKALVDTLKKKDSTPMERLEINRTRVSLEEQCERYLMDSDDIYEFEALPSAIDAVLEVLESPKFQEKYEFSQVSDTCFLVKLRELNIL